MRESVWSSKSAVTSERQNLPSVSFDMLHDKTSNYAAKLSPIGSSNSTKQTPIYGLQSQTRSLPTWTESCDKHCELYLGNLQNARRGPSSLHGVLNMLQTYKLQAAQEYSRALTIESHPLHDELQSNNDLAVLRLKRVIPWTKASRDS